jgi:hypothetical protein
MYEIHVQLDFPQYPTTPNIKNLLYKLKDHLKEKKKMVHMICRSGFFPIYEKYDICKRGEKPNYENTLSKQPKYSIYCENSKEWTQMINNKPVKFYGNKIVLTEHPEENIPMEATPLNKIQYIFEVDAVIDFILELIDSPNGVMADYYFRLRTDRGDEYILEHADKFESFICRIL